MGTTQVFLPGEFLMDRGTWPATKVSMGLQRVGIDLVIEHARLNFIEVESYNMYFFVSDFFHLWASLVAQTVKNQPEMQETPV